METTKADILTRIPEDWTALKEFISKVSDYSYFERRQEVLLVDEVDFCGKQFLIEIDTEKNTVKFVDDLVDLDAFQNATSEDIDREEWNKSLEILMDEIADTGFALKNSGNGGNDDYIWHYLSINPKKFSEDKLSKATTLWKDYNVDKRARFQ